MSALKALPQAVGIVGRNPAVLLPAALLAALSTLSIVFQSTSANVAVAVGQLAFSLAQLFVGPFVAAGLYGMLNEARSGSTSFGTFASVGRKYFLYLLGAQLVVGVLFAVLGVVVVGAVLAAIGFGAIDAMLHGTPPLAALGASGVAAIVVGALVLLLIQLFVQFYDVALVLADAGLAGSLSRSVGVVRENLVSAVGFSIVNQAVGLLLLAPVLAYLYPRLQSLPSDPVALSESIESLATDPTLLAITFVVSVVSTTFLYAYKTAFYARVDPEVRDGHGDRPGGNGTATAVGAD